MQSGARSHGAAVGGFALVLDKQPSAKDLAGRLPNLLLDGLARH